MEDEDEDELPVRRTGTPLGRLDDQRAGFSAHAHTSSTSTPYGSPSQSREPAPRLRRPSPKSAGSASLPMLARHDSWENPPQRRASLTRIETGREGEGPFANSSRGDWDHRSRSETSFLPGYAADLDFRRRGSAVSTSSALSSYSPQSRTFPPLPGSTNTSFKRYSVSSIGAYTIGDKSTTSSSMPLLRRQDTRESHGDSRPSSPTRRGSERQRPSSSGAGAGGTSAGGTSVGGTASRGQRNSSASYTYSDTLSLHSYPPRPRQRAGSSTMRGVNNEAFASGRSWAREMEAANATGHVQRRGSADSRTDAWPSFLTNSFVHVPVAKPSPSYQSALSTYSFPAIPSRSLGVPSPPMAYNPLAPLRKRLMRSLAVTIGARQLHTEVQLLLELIDALEHCITSFAPLSNRGALARASSDSMASSAAGQGDSIAPLTAASSSHSSARDEADDDGLAASTACSTRSSNSTAGAATSSAKEALVDEVRLLVREVVELVPAAQRCLSDGAYGPLGFPTANVSTRTLLVALEQAGRELAVDPEWWPRRLVRDCRALLDEAGLPTGQGSAAQTVWALATKLNEEADAAADAKPSPLSSPPRSPAMGGAFQPRGPGGMALSDARREELLLQGKRRWEQYRERQSALEQYTDRPLP